MTDLNIQDQIAAAVATYSPTDAALAALREECMPLRTNGVDDKRAFSLVVEKRREVKKLRVAVEKRRKELKAGVLEYGRGIDGAAKEITAKLEPIEAHLIEQEKLVTDEVARIEREAEEARQAKLRDRMQALAAVGHHALPMEVQALDEDGYQLLLDTVTHAHEEKLRAEAKAKAEREAEEARLREEREKLDAERAAIAKERAALEAARAAERELEDLPAGPEQFAALEGLDPERLAKDAKERPAPIREGAIFEGNAELTASTDQRRPGYIYLVTREDHHELVSTLEDHRGVALKALRSWVQDADAAYVEEYEIQQEGGAS